MLTYLDDAVLRCMDDAGFGVWICSDRLVLVSLLGFTGSRRDEPESLILAQSERWRHA